MNNQNEPALEEEDSIFAYTNERRKHIVTTLMKEDMALKDPAYAKIVLQALDGLDKVALGRKRIKVDEKINTNQEMAAGLIARLLNSTAGSKLYETTMFDINRKPPTLGTEIPNPILVEGETSVNALAITFETFIAGRSNEDYPASN